MSGRDEGRAELAPSPPQNTKIKNDRTYLKTVLGKSSLAKTTGALIVVATKQPPQIRKHILTTEFQKIEFQNNLKIQIQNSNLATPPDFPQIIRTKSIGTYPIPEYVRNGKYGCDFHRRPQTFRARPLAAAERDTSSDTRARKHAFPRCPTPREHFTQVKEG